MSASAKPAAKTGTRVFVNGHWGFGVIECFVNDLWCPVYGHSAHYGVRVNGDYLVWVPQEAVEKSLAEHEVTS